MHVTHIHFLQRTNVQNRDVLSKTWIPLFISFKLSKLMWKECIEWGYLNKKVWCMDVSM